MTDRTKIETQVVVRATAALQKEVLEDINTEEPSKEVAKAAIKEATVINDDTRRND